MKPKLHLIVRGATHFLNYERPYFEKYFDLVSRPGPDTIIFAYGPDAFDVPPTLPARLRVAYVLPGFAVSPLYDEARRTHLLDTIETSYDLVFTNPGPIYEALKSSPKVITHLFAAKVSIADRFRARTAINTLIHVSGEQPQKDSARSKEIMALTGLPHELYPPRHPYTARDKRMHRFRRWLQRHELPAPLFLHPNYVRHATVINKYLEYDGFVHVAGEVPPYSDGKYTASFLEAGLTGAILFWHDTLGLGNDFETVFDLPLDPPAAARRILEIRNSINVEQHSRATSEEIREKADPEKVTRFRYEKIMELL